MADAERTRDEFNSKGDITYKEVIEILGKPQRKAENTGFQTIDSTAFEWNLSDGGIAVIYFGLNKGTHNGEDIYTNIYYHGYVIWVGIGEKP